MKIFIWIIRFIAYATSHIFPKDRRLCIYNGALDNFVDNEKYCFIYASNNYKQYRHIWVTNKEDVIKHLRFIGLNAVKQNSLYGIYLTLRAFVVIYGGGMLCPYLTGGAIRCNLWHGIPLKKINYDDEKHIGKYKPNSIKGWLLRRYAPDSYVLTTSYELVDIFSRAFNVKRENVIVGGYYRTLPFFENRDELINNIRKYENEGYRKWIEKLADTTYDKRIIYMPTFRDAKLDFLSEAIPNFEKLNAICMNNNILFILKLHRFCQTKVDLSNFSNICLFESDLDVYPILPFTDVLITDYSSIFFDYALMEEKNIIYYPFDLNAYKSQSRELYFEYNDVVGTNIVYDFNGLINALQNNNQSERVVSMQFYDDKLNFAGLLNRILLN